MKRWWKNRVIKYKFINRTLGLVWLIFDIIVDVLVYFGWLGAVIVAAYFSWRW